MYIQLGFRIKLKIMQHISEEDAETTNMLHVKHIHILCSDWWLNVLVVSVCVS